MKIIWANAIFYISKSNEINYVIIKYLILQPFTTISEVSGVYIYV